MSDPVKPEEAVAAPLAMVAGQREFEQGQKLFGSTRGSDSALAFDLCLIAAKAGYPEAQYAVGIMCRDGRGTVKHIDSAEVWLLYASQSGHEKATEALAALKADAEIVEAPAFLENQVWHGADAADLDSGTSNIGEGAERRAKQRATTKKVAARRKAIRTLTLFGLFLAALALFVLYRYLQR